MTRRTWTLLISVVLVLSLGLLGGFVRVPYVALSPGPVADTLGKDRDTTVVEISDENTFPTAGELLMTTVSLTDGITLFGALGMWISGRFALAPREELFPPDKSKQQIEAENAKQFEDSQNNAENAALRYLKYPVKVLVSKVLTDGPANKVLEPGDQLLVVNGKAVTNANEVRGALESTTPGQSVEVKYRRGELEQAVSLTLAKLDGRPYGYLGVEPTERPDVKFKIKIALKDVGGPSAGLMFALSIVDKLTPGELNGGKKIAGTGEINVEGKVGPIGGIPFKMVAAKEHGATIFLVPAANCVEARQRAPEGLRLVKVDTLTDAVNSLESLKAGGDAPGCG